MGNPGFGRNGLYCNKDNIYNHISLLLTALNLAKPDLKLLPIASIIDWKKQELEWSSIYKQSNFKRPSHLMKARDLKSGSSKVK